MPDLPFDPRLVNDAMVTPQWAGVLRAGVDRATLTRWDPWLIRDPRLLVPVDVQALYIPQGDAEPMVRLPFGLTEPDGKPPAPAPEPFSPGTPREPGVYLHWAMPDALLRGKVVEPGTEADKTNPLSLPALPDRWVVARILLPAKGDQPLVRCWVIEADTARVVDLASWPAADAPSQGRTLKPEELTGVAGGSLAWTAGYDATQGRMSFHDPLDDLATVDDQGGPMGDMATYAVAGWWSKPALDPLDRTWQKRSLDAYLHSLGWTLVEDAEGGARDTAKRALDAERRASIGLATAARFSPTRAALVTESAKVVEARAVGWPGASLLHGFVAGVPVRGEVPLDSRPAPVEIRSALGHHNDDVIAALASPGLGATEPDQRRAVERLVSAFTGQLLPRLGSPDGVVDVEEHEHTAGFGSQPGGDGQRERLKTGQSAATTGRRLKTGPKVKLAWAGRTRMDLTSEPVDSIYRRVADWTVAGDSTGSDVETREVLRPAPRYHLALEPVLAVSGLRRSLRHGGDGRYSPDGLLQCRWPTQVIQDMPSLLRGSELLPSLGSGAIPSEVDTIVREAVMLAPYHAPWLARVAAARRGLSGIATHGRFVAEAALRFGANGLYTGDSAAFVDPVAAPVTSAAVASELRRFSAFAGVDPDPVGVTAWAQPWIPLWLEWEAEARLGDRTDGWTLGPIDLDPPEEAEPAEPRTFQGRSLLTTGTAVTLASAVREWILAEEARDRAGAGELDEASQAKLAAVGGTIGHLDVVSATLDGLREALLGLPYDNGLVRPAGSAKLVPLVPPQLVAAGELRMVRARLVDAFGRTLDIPLDRLLIPARDETGGQLRMRPRLTRPARWLFRLVDPASTEPDADEARVDQVDPTLAVSPVAGFLLPDHIDEALEVFDAGGAPLGQLMNDAITGGVQWEIAPGRAGPADAGPGFGLPDAQRCLGWFAAGMVATDAQVRAGRVADPAAESALSALLRAIDTSLWTVDPFAGLGTEHIAGLVGRPIAVVRARLRLDMRSDVDELDLSAPGAREARERAYAELAERPFRVRIGELTRSDDGVLGYFIGTDFSKVYLVDRALRQLAFDGGRMRGQLGRYGASPQVPDRRPILHPYLADGEILTVHPGQVVTLTILMHPASRVTLTSGVLPRKALSLARDWVAPALAAMSPSVRVGPVLVDPAQVRLPKVSALPKEQLFTRRDTPYSWKNDPILAATQTALLPDLPAQVQEGYIRVNPDPPGEDGTP